jgi:3-hydroxymyristoyl/3-hydroxydecanoyl-(acyl carrier protein) dehydratase
VEVYGSTETGGIGWREGSEEGNGDLWTPFPGIEFRSTDSDAQHLISPYLDASEEVRLDDRIDLCPDGRFRLGPRLDRIVKVEGKRLSLPDMENHLLRHPWIRDAAITVRRRGRDEVCAAVVLHSDGQDQVRRDRRVVADALRDFLRAWHDPVMLPKRWRFVDTLATNTRGKLSASDLYALFETRTIATLPPIRSAHRSPNRIELEIYLPADLPCFEGHFPGLPVLPGVIQIDWAIRMGREYLGCQGQFRAIDNLRFLSVVQPECAPLLVLTVNEERTRLGFSYALGARKCSSGTVIFQP